MPLCNVTAAHGNDREQDIIPNDIGEREERTLFTPHAKKSGDGEGEGDRAGAPQQEHATSFVRGK